MTDGGPGEVAIVYTHLSSNPQATIVIWLLYLYQEDYCTVNKSGFTASASMHAALGHDTWMVIRGIKLLSILLLLS